MNLDLDAIKARCEAATQGPWKVAEPGYRVARDDGTGFLVASTFMATDSRDLPDATFIAHARTDVPALVAEVDRLRAELAEVELERDLLASRVVELEPSGSFRVDL